jgi:hypothetical protein
MGPILAETASPFQITGNDGYRWRLEQVHVGRGTCARRAGAAETRLVHEALRAVRLAERSNAGASDLGCDLPSAN